MMPTSSLSDLGLTTSGNLRVATRRRHFLARKYLENQSCQTSLRIPTDLQDVRSNILGFIPHWQSQHTHSGYLPHSIHHVNNSSRLQSLLRFRYFRSFFLSRNHSFVFQGRCIRTLNHNVMNPTSRGPSGCPRQLRRTAPD